MYSADCEKNERSRAEERRPPPPHMAGGSSVLRAAAAAAAAVGPKRTTGSICARTVAWSPASCEGAARRDREGEEGSRGGVADHGSSGDRIRPSVVSRGSGRYHMQQQRGGLAGERRGACQAVEALEVLAGDFLGHASARSDRGGAKPEEGRGGREGGRQGSSTRVKSFYVVSIASAGTVLLRMCMLYHAAVGAQNKVGGAPERSLSSSFRQRAAERGIKAPAVTATISARTHRQHST